MGRKGSRKRRIFTGSTSGHATLVALKLPPGNMPLFAKPAPAIPLASHPEPLVVARQRETVVQPDQIAPLPRNMSLVDPNQPMARRLRNWLVGLAEKWAARHKPLPEAPTIAQLDRLRKELASVQRKLDRMLG